MLSLALLLVLVSIVITLFGEERADLCASRAFVCFARVSFYLLSLLLGVRVWLRLVTATLPGFFYYKF